MGFCSLVQDLHRKVAAKLCDEFDIILLPNFRAKVRARRAVQAVRAV